jgi:SpoVK/Ycf46/Vps4 family AAA+-type ATPase
MKKKNIINLIRCYSESNDSGFRNEAYEIARDFDRDGDYDLAEYIMSLLSSANSFVPQENMEQLFFCQKVANNNSSLPLPDAIKNDVVGIVNAIGHNVIVNKFLFQGAPGTGKTETAKQIARLTNRTLYIVNFDLLIDSKLGQTSKNIAALFDEINKLIMPDKAIVLFDEIDAIALDRTNNNDLREMGRATSSVLKGFDSLRSDIVIIATTNLYTAFDKALIRRFDAVVDFNRYTQEDLIEIGEFILKEYIALYTDAAQDIRLFKKILRLFHTVPYPGDLRNLIKTSLAFSSQTDRYDYLKRLYHSVTGKQAKDIFELSKQGFSLRDIEILSGVSKSQVARELNKKDE